MASYFIGRTPDLQVNELRATLNVTKQALNAPLRELFERGFVAETIDAEDQRIKHLRLTEGSALEETISGHQRRRFARAFAEVGPTKERAWREVMHLLAADEAEDRLRCWRDRAQVERMPPST